MSGIEDGTTGVGGEAQHSLPPYACPSCGGDQIAAAAVETKTVYIDGEGQIEDEGGGSHTDFDGGFRCTDCGNTWGEPSRLERAVEHLGSVSYLAADYLTTAEESMLYGVLDSLQAKLEEEREGGQRRMTWGELPLGVDRLEGGDRRWR